MERIDCLVVGAGVVGLAIARAFARAGREVIVVESESSIGSGISSRNSEVIHAGIYYRPGLDKTRLCIDGKAMLYDFCRDYGIPHKRCGKLLVAANEGETDKLAEIKAQAETNGVDDLVWLSGTEARALEPELVAARALLSPSTGIVDSHAFMLALLGDAERHGAMIALETPVIRGEVDPRGLVIETGGASPSRIGARLVINAAGTRRSGGCSIHLRNACGQGSAPAPRQGQLFFAGDALALLASHLSGANARRPRRASDPRSCRKGALRARRRMDRGDRLRGRSETRRNLLRRRSNILAGIA